MLSTLPKTLKINHPDEDRAIEVATDKYVTAKLAGLKEFGYPTLLRSEVEMQLERVLAGESLDIIGMFIQRDIFVPIFPDPDIPF